MDDAKPKRQRSRITSKMMKELRERIASGETVSVSFIQRNYKLTQEKAEDIFNKLKL